MLAAVIGWSSPTLTRRRRLVSVARYGQRGLASEEQHFGLWHTFRGADVARVASGIGVIWVIMVGM